MTGTPPPAPTTGTAGRTVIDGACSGNPGPGAWAYRLEWPDGRVDEAAGAEAATTNNREELKAVREALLAVRRRIGSDPAWIVVVRTDSLGAVNWLTGGWKRKANLDLFPGIDPLVDRRVRFEHVRGHAGHPGNERVDTLAVEATRRLMEAVAAGAAGGDGGSAPDRGGSPSGA
jgi:ribonuclease HI